MNYFETKSIDFMGVKISNASYRVARDTLTKIVADRGKGYVCLNDVSNIIEATHDKDLKAAINESTFSLADGMPLAWYARLVGCSEIERLSGMHFMRRMLAEKDGYKHYLLGDTDETIASVMEEARKLNQDIKITGYSPPFKSFTEQDNREILEKIKMADPDVIWVSFGGGKQEKWMHQQIRSLDRGVMVGAGAAFKWLIGEITTPPEIVQKMGLQWLYRFAHEFLKNPKGLNSCKRRRYIHHKLSFLANLPLEVTQARRNLRNKKEAK